MTYDIPLTVQGLNAAKKFFAESKERQRSSWVPFGIRRAQHGNSLSEKYILRRLIVTKLSFDHDNKVMTAEVTV